MQANHERVDPETPQQDRSDSETPRQDESYYKMHQIMGLDDANKFDIAAGAHVRQDIVAWCFETLDEERKRHSDQNPSDESQDSAGALTLDPAEAKRMHEEREADGFDAPRRLREWIQKYKPPAAGGGSKGKSKGSDDQRFSNKVIERLAAVRRALIKKSNLKPETIKTTDDANKLFRPYLSLGGGCAAAPAAAATTA